MLFLLCSLFQHFAFPFLGHLMYEETKAHKVLLLRHLAAMRETHSPQQHQIRPRNPEKFLQISKGKGSLLMRVLRQAVRIMQNHPQSSVLVNWSFFLREEAECSVFCRHCLSTAHRTFNCPRGSRDPLLCGFCGDHCINANKVEQNDARLSLCKVFHWNVPS